MQHILKFHCHSTWHCKDMNSMKMFSYLSGNMLCNFKKNFHNKYNKNNYTLNIKYFNYYHNILHHKDKNSLINLLISFFNQTISKLDMQILNYFCKYNNYYYRLYIYYLNHHHNIWHCKGKYFSINIYSPLKYMLNNSLM